MDELWLMCEGCKEKKADAKKVNDPYVEELFGREEEVVLCDDCYHDRCMDI